jgi:hypothetical protein
LEHVNVVNHKSRVGFIRHWLILLKTMTHVNILTNWLILFFIVFNILTNWLICTAEFGAGNWRLSTGKACGRLPAAVSHWRCRAFS